MKYVSHNSDILSLIDNLFTENEKIKLDTFCTILESDSKDLSELWEYDQSLGGLGGYAMPSNPVKNPFNTWGRERNLFRSVQYAKSGLVYYPHIPRNVIVDCGRSLEFLCKYVLNHNKKIPRATDRQMLGKTLDKLRKSGMLHDELYDSCAHLSRLWNIAKHEIRGFEDHTRRTFSTIDGVVAYFSLRKIHNQLLEIIQHPRTLETYEIYQDAHFL